MDITYLKLQNIDIMEFSTEDGYYKIHKPDMLPLSLRGFISDTVHDRQGITRENIGEYIKKYSKFTDAIGKFYAERSLSLNRENAKFILNALGIPQTNDYETKKRIMELCKALSVSDDYWITKDKNEKWENVNVRDNPLHKTLAQISLLGRSLSITGEIRTPELTGQGCYAKTWIRKNERLYLLKAGTKDGNEPQREALMSNLLDCTNVPHVEYLLKKVEGKTVTCCPSMSNKIFGMVSAAEIYTWCQHCDQNFWNYILKTDPEMYLKTIIADYLCSNRDRHFGNWGFYMDNRTGKLLRIHPLYDHNNAFDSEFMADKTGGVCQLLPGKSQKEAALYAIKKCDFRITKPITRKMFPDDKMYLSFMERGTELGLFKEKKVSFLDKLPGKKTDLYETVEIKPDNSDEYWTSLRKMTEPERKEKEQVEEWKSKVMPVMTIPAAIVKNDDIWSY